MSQINVMKYYPKHLFLELIGDQVQLEKSAGIVVKIESTNPATKHKLPNISMPTQTTSHST